MTSEEDATLASMKGDTFSEPAYFAMDTGAVRRVTFQPVEDDNDW